jgi:glycosyltransferase involved in cell wall biosynthesis
MIVKNESKIITRLLQSVLHVIDSYCICDTGSTDDTVNIITHFFQSLPGKIIHEPFRNFAYNRNYALEKCKGMSDYILLLDADMILETGNFDKYFFIIIKKHSV